MQHGHIDRIGEHFVSESWRWCPWHLERTFVQRFHGNILWWTWNLLHSVQDTFERWQCVRDAGDPRSNVICEWRIFTFAHVLQTKVEERTSNGWKWNRNRLQNTHLTHIRNLLLFTARHMISSIGHTFDDLREIFLTRFWFDSRRSVQNIVHRTEAQTFRCDIQRLTAFRVVVNEWFGDAIIISVFGGLFSAIQGFHCNWKCIGEPMWVRLRLTHTYLWVDENSWMAAHYSLRTHTNQCPMVWCLWLPIPIRHRPMVSFPLALLKWIQDFLFVIFGTGMLRVEVEHSRSSCNTRMRRSFDTRFIPAAKISLLPRFQMTVSLSNLPIITHVSKASLPSVTTNGPPVPTHKMKRGSIDFVIIVQLNNGFGTKKLTNWTVTGHGPTID